MIRAVCAATSNANAPGLQRPREQLRNGVQISTIIIYVCLGQNLNLARFICPSFVPSISERSNATAKQGSLGRSLPAPHAGGGLQASPGFGRYARLLLVETNLRQGPSGPVRHIGRYANIF